jgi:hypothetical protein
MDKSRISTCSIAVIEKPPEEAFATIRAAGYKKVDVLERVPHLSLFPEECDPAALKAVAEANGLQIANLATYAGGGNDGRSVAWSWHDWTVAKPEQFTSYGFSSLKGTDVCRLTNTRCPFRDSRGRTTSPRRAVTVHVPNGTLFSSGEPISTSELFKCKRPNFRR